MIKKQDVTDVAWHAVPAADVETRLGIAAGAGLSQEAAAGRLKTFGPNRLPAARKRGLIVRFLI